MARSHRWDAALIVMRRSIFDGRNLLGSKRVLPPIGVHGGRGSFGGRHLSVMSRLGPKTSDSSVASSVRTTRVAGPDPWGASSRSSCSGGTPTLISRNLAAMTSYPLGEMVRWDRGKDQLGHACDSVAPDPGDPRAEHLLGQRPGKGAAECQDHGSASGTAPSASKDQSQPARGPCPHPFSARIAGERAAADLSPVPLPHGG
jgi:hypothetical protein